MSLHNKYNDVLKLGEDIGVKDGYVEEADGKLKIGGKTNTQFEKDRMWDKIKEIGGEYPSDIEANIEVENSDVYHRHVVKGGESLSKISKMYYGDPMKYMEIFKANTGVLKNPDMIHPGQELEIPFPKA